MSHKILLIEPPFYRLFKDTYSLIDYPLSLGYLSGMIKKETTWKAKTYVADFHPNQDKLDPLRVSYLATDGFHNYLNNLRDTLRPIWREVGSVISEYNPDIIGISVKSQNFPSTCIVAKLAKSINVNITVVAGGPHPTMVGADVLRCPDIDICVKGEGEQTVVELLNAIGEQKELDAVKGIIYRKNGQIVETGSRELIEDLDSICFPYENALETLIDYHKYPLYAFGSIIATRGCPYNCFFCGTRRMWGNKVRFRSTDNVVSEIKLRQKAGIHCIHFDDDTFGVNKHYINELCNAIIAHCPDLKWSCEIHVNLVDDEVVSLMKKSGCCAIQLGIESGDDEILRKIRKNITAEKALSACKIIKKHGIVLYTFFMLGFPWETEESIKNTVSVMRKTRSDFVIYSIFTPYPGTEAFEYCRQNGLIDNDFDLSLYYHQSPANYFCPKIPQKRFRALASKVERMVDKANFSKQNRLLRIIKLFSLSKFRKARRLGLRGSFKRVIGILTGNAP